MSELLPGGAGALRALRRWKQVLTPQPRSLFDSVAAGRALAVFYGLVSLDGSVRAGRGSSPRQVRARLSQAHSDWARCPASTARSTETGAAMAIDAATRRTWSLRAKLDGAAAGKLLAVIDRTVAGAGASSSGRLTHPLTDLPPSGERSMPSAFWSRRRARGRSQGGLVAVPCGACSFAPSLGRGGRATLRCARRAWPDSGDTGCPRRRG